MHPKIQASKFQIEEDEFREKFQQNSLECLIGTREGTIYVYDPVLIMKGNVFLYNESGTPFYKAKRPEIVRWVEPIVQQSAHSADDKEPQHILEARKFAVCFEDGCIYIYYKGDPNMSKQNEDYTKQ